MAHPIKIIAILKARPEKESALRTLLEGMVTPSRNEPGTLRWDIWQDQADPSRFVLDELYLDHAAIAAHRETPHFKHYVSRINELAERTAFVLDPQQIA